jgi:ABC-type spermidine/putrescine transport system permease subunit I
MDGTVKKVRQGSTTAPHGGLVLPAVLFLAVFYLLPGALMLLLSAGQPPTFALDVGKLSAANFYRFFASGYYVESLLRSIEIGVATASFAAVFGYPVAYFLARSPSRFRQPLFFITLIPMAVGMNMITLGWLVILGRNGIINALVVNLGIVERPLEILYTWLSLVVALANVLFTFMVLPIAAVLQNIDPSIAQAARNLGAGPVQTFLLTTLPLSLEGIAAGFLAVFMQASGALVMPLLLGGQSNIILPVSIWEQFTVANDANFAAALAMILLSMSLAVLVIQLNVTRTRQYAP